jgi:hypothetical protein
LGELHLMPQDHEEFRYFKPDGLWVSIPGEDDWESFSRQNDMRPDRLAHRTLVELHGDARVLRLSSAEDIDGFTRRFAFRYSFASYHTWVDWKAIAEAYQGVIIAPYIWSRRLCRETAWYYTWDCASGCIWDPAAISKLSPMPVSP